jgi:hypothetical protein
MPPETEAPQHEELNSFLLCAVVAKRTRHLERLIPDRRIPDLIAMALRDCADHALKLDVGPDTPGILRLEAMQMGQVDKAPAVLEKDSSDGPRPKRAPLDGRDSYPRPVPRIFSLNNSGGIDAAQVRQLRAIAENLSTEAGQHQTKQDYLVAYGLYGRALSVLDSLSIFDKEVESLRNRIRQDQQTVFELLRAGENLGKTPQSDVPGRSPYNGRSAA